MLMNSTPIQRLMWLRAISGSTEKWETIKNTDIATFETFISAPLQKLTIGITAAQSGSGDASPTNIRPITGWSGANITISPTQDAQDGTVYPVSWQSKAGAVYGGTLDVTTGLLTTTETIADMSTLNWTRSRLAGTDDKYRFMASPSDMKVVDSQSIILCSVYKTIPSSQLKTTDLAVTITNNYPNIYVRDEAVLTSTAFKTKVAGQKVVYTLKTPITYQLTPLTIQTLLGANNVWADTGEIVELTYRKK